MTDSLSEIARRLLRLERAQQRATTPQLANSSIEDGAVESYVDDTLGLIVGAQFDGSQAVAAVNGPTPPIPSDAQPTPALAGAKVYWDGLFADADYAPMDFSRVEIHASTDPLFTAEFADTIVGTYETPRGGKVYVSLEPGSTWYIRLVTRSMSGKRSEPSTPVGVVPQDPATGGGGGGTDGIPPAASPTPEVIPGFDFFAVQWDAVPNADLVTYEVHVSDTAGFTPSAATLAAEVKDTQAVVRGLPQAPLLRFPFDTPYYFRIVAKDEDNPAPASVEATGSLTRLDASADIIARTITGNLLAINAVLAENIDSEAITARHIASRVITGEHIEFDTLVGDHFLTGGIGDGALAANAISGTLMNVIPDSSWGDPQWLARRTATLPDGWTFEAVPNEVDAPWTPVAGRTFTVTDNAIIPESVDLTISGITSSGWQGGIVIPVDGRTEAWKFWIGDGHEGIGEVYDDVTLAISLLDAAGDVVVYDGIYQASFHWAFSTDKDHTFTIRPSAYNNVASIRVQVYTSTTRNYIPPGGELTIRGLNFKSDLLCVPGGRLLCYTHSATSVPEVPIITNLATDTYTRWGASYSSKKSRAVDDTILRPTLELVGQRDGLDQNPPFFSLWAVSGAQETTPQVWSSVTSSGVNENHQMNSLKATLHVRGDGMLVGDKVWFQAVSVYPVGRTTASSGIAHIEPDRLELGQERIDAATTEGIPIGYLRFDTLQASTGPYFEARVGPQAWLRGDQWGWQFRGDLEIYSGNKIVQDPPSIITLTPTMSGISSHNIQIREIAPGTVALVGHLDVDDTDTTRRDTGMRIPVGMRPAAEIIVASVQYGGTGAYRYFFQPNGMIEFQQTGQNGPYEAVNAIWFAAS